MRLRDRDEIESERLRTRLTEAALRWLCGVILLLFAAGPAWFLARLALDVARQPSEFSYGGLVGAAIVAVVLGFLLLLAYRAFTGRGRSSDGGLLPPWLMYVVLASLSLLVTISLTRTGYGLGSMGLWLGAAFLMFMMLAFETYRYARGLLPPSVMYGVYAAFFLFGLGISVWGFIRFGFLGLILGASFLWYAGFAWMTHRAARRRSSRTYV